MAAQLDPLMPPWPGEPESMIVTTDTADQLHYLDWGGPSEPLAPLLLIHGLAATAWSWAPVARRVRSSTRVLALDVRGHGLSDSPRTGYDLESLAFDALTVLAANGSGREVGGRPAVVVGHGLGAMVAAAMAAAQPESVCGLGLVDGGWEDLAEATGMGPDEYLRPIRDPPEVMASMSAYLADRREYDPPTWDADQERAARAAVDEKYAGHVAPVLRPHAMRGAVAAMFDYRPREVLGRLDVPLLVAVAEAGTADDETARERRLALDEVLAARADAALPPAQVRYFTGAGHNLMRYRAAELSRALRDLLTAAQSHQRS